jgi:HPr kinase/phosphorylase
MDGKKYERLGIDEYYANILDVKVPELTIPVAPGRNLAIIVETASLNQRLKNKGYFAAIEMNKRLMEQMNSIKK